MRRHHTAGVPPLLCKCGFMMLRRFLAVIGTALVTLLSSCVRQDLRVALIDSDHVSGQIDSLGAMLSSEDGVSCSVIEAGSETDLSRFDVVWFHRPDSSAFSETERNLAERLLAYVGAGGKLLLSMDAVRLLNESGVEDSPISAWTYDAVDYGFGRKVGFHSFRSHPLFDGMNGGAYVWHGHDDNKCRVLGFPKGVSPAADGTKVIGIFWEYIYYHPDEKVIWETPYGKGNILSVGGMLNYGAPNYNRCLLERFTRNCVEYLAGTLKSAETSRYWDYSERPVTSEEGYEYESVDIPGPTRWTLPEDSHALSWKATGNEVNIAGRRTTVICKENGGIFEIWTHPFMSLRDCRVFVKTAGGCSLLGTEETDIQLRANSIIREYSAGGIRIREVITGSVDSPSAVAHYEWEDDSVEEIYVDFKTNLRYMWPYSSDALGTICYGWSDGLNAFVSSDRDREFVSIVGFNVPARIASAGQYDGFGYDSGAPVGIPTDLRQVNASVRLDVKGTRCFDVLFAAGDQGEAQAEADYKAIAAAPYSVFSSSDSYYKDYVASKAIVETPDSIFNEGYYWAAVSSEQFNVDVPGMGKGLFAGYSSSRRGWNGGQKVSGRPGYAWFFGRDAEWSSLAFLEMGDFQAVRDLLENLIRYQRLDGKIYHEATTSGSIHYDASDATPFFVVLMGKYLKASGDVEFVKRNITAVHKALAFCASTDTNGDGLPENTNVGHGWLEGGQFYGSVTELVVAALYCRGLYEGADICRLTGDRANAERYSSEADKVRNIINRDYWNESRGYFNFGKMPDGTFTKDFLALTSSSIYFGDLDYAKSRETALKYADLRMSGDWGVSSVADTCRLESYGAYSEDNIWPLFTGSVALAEFGFGRYIQGFSHIMHNLLAYKGEFHGRIPEVLNGREYRSNGITRNQCWSETMTVLPVLEGMVGFCPDALNASARLAPRLPLDWGWFKVSNLRVGEGRLNMSMTRSTGEFRYLVTSDKPLDVTMMPSYGIGTEILSVNVDGTETDFSVEDDEEYTTIRFHVKVKDSNEIVVRCREKAAPLPHYRTPGVRDTRRYSNIIFQKVVNGDLVLTVQGLSGTKDTISVYAPGGVRCVEGAEGFVKSGSDVYDVAVDFPATKDKSVTKQVTIIHNI